MNVKQIFTILFFAQAMLSANQLLPVTIDTKKIQHLANYKGRKLDCHLVYKFANPIPEFKAKIAKSETLTEAIYHTDIILESALKDLMLLEKSSLADQENIKTLLLSENFINVIKAIELVALALQSLIIKEKLVDEHGQLTFMGNQMLKVIKSIVQTSLKREELDKDSHFMKILDALDTGKEGLDKALEDMKKSWEDPSYAIKCVMEIRVFAIDICFDVPAIREHKEFRSPTECFNANIEKLKNFTVK